MLFSRLVRVPEGTVPVFLTREDARRRRDQLRGRPARWPAEERELEALDAALKESGDA